MSIIFDIIHVANFFCVSNNDLHNFGKNYEIMIIVKHVLFNKIIQSMIFFKKKRKKSKKKSSWSHYYLIIKCKLYINITIYNVL